MIKEKNIEDKKELISASYTIFENGVYINDVYQNDKVLKEITNGNKQVRGILMFNEKGEYLFDPVDGDYIDGSWSDMDDVQLKECSQKYMEYINSEECKILNQVYINKKASPLEAVLDNERVLEEMMNNFINYIINDDENAAEAMGQLVKKYLDYDDKKREIIDQVLIALCGYKLENLI